jgi:hypothetical protein
MRAFEMEHTDRNGRRWQIGETSTVMLVDGQPAMVSAVELACVDDRGLRWIIPMTGQQTFHDLVATRGAEGVEELILFAIQNLEPTPTSSDPDTPAY